MISHTMDQTNGGPTMDHDQTNQAAIITSAASNLRTMGPWDHGCDHMTRPTKHFLGRIKGIRKKTYQEINIP